MLQALGPTLTLLFAQLVPGGASDYWQQEVHYTIEATLVEDDGVVRGAGTLEYRNRSPDTLDEIYLHLHLNAFRPGSVWARNERREQLNFQALVDPDYGFERLHVMRAGEAILEPEFPFSPDSTVVRFALPEPLAPGDAVSLSFEWDARPSTLCRRQCRRGRHFDFAQWYPRVAPYDAGGWQAHPLYPQGEFYGEFATYDVTLDVAADQVVGATGVPLEGDPGWQPEPGSPAPDASHQRGWYRDPLPPSSPGFLPESAAAGRKRVRFYAEDVHHFAWTASPDYRYEGGSHRDVAIHVLYRPGDLDWDLGAAVARTARALEWLEGVFGPYPYPQLTNVHRLEGGGTEFPMMIMDGSPGQGLITHETAHQYAHGILANNEWRDAWLDEGMASFLTSWFFEDHGVTDAWSGALERVASRERQGLSLPVGTVSEDIPDFGTYGLLAYTKPSVVYYMLREHVGRDTFREALRNYFATKKLQHVTEADLRKAVEEASGEDLGWFFDQWIHSTATLDYALGNVEQNRGADGRWRTQVEVVRSGEAWMPVTLRVGEQERRLDSREPGQTVELITSARPALAELDPALVLLDIDRSNNRKVIPAP